MAKSSPILHVFVIGFHHKRGCQVDYCFPSLPKGTSANDDNLPVEWRGLPSLALPDGAHNCEKDTVFFHLPCRENPNRTIFGVSCYRQISADKLTNKSEDVTRCTVQKSVCVLSTVPMYGLLKAKLELITQAYFEQCDFDRVELLAEMYDHLTLTVTSDLLDTQSLIGLSARELVVSFHHSILCLFKLILLEKRVLFYAFPVQYLSHTILALLSLFPRMIEEGLVESAYYAPKTAATVLQSQKSENAVLAETSEKKMEDSILDPDDSLVREIEITLRDNQHVPLKAETPTETNVIDVSTNDIDLAEDALSCSTERKTIPATRLVIDNWGFPLSIFTKGNLCHPYLSLAYMDWLSSDSIRAYVIGATNALFKQRKELFDAIVVIDDAGAHIDILDPELKRAVSLTTADLRFCDYLIRHVVQTGDILLDATMWEGGDEWIRLQFRAYLLSLLATADCGDASKEDDFNRQFIRCWKTTHNYRVWLCGHHGGAMNAVAGHPFQGQVGVADMKLRLTHTIQNTDQGRKINQAVNQTGRYVAQTGRAVGGALKSVVGQIWSGFNDSQ